MRFFLLLIIELGLAAPALHATEMPKTVIVYDSEGRYDFRHNFTVAVVKAALDVGKDRLGPVDVRLTHDSMPEMNRARAMAEIESNKGLVHVMSRQGSEDLEQKLRGIPFSLAGSLLGERIFLMRPDRREEMERIQSLATLKRYTIGVGSDWIDARVMKAAGFQTETTASYELLFSMLRGRRFDLLSRGLHEAWDELRLRAFKDLDWQTGLVVSYPAPFYLYVNKQQTQLAERLIQGLRALESNGRLDRLVIDHFGPALVRANCWDRQRFIVKNPYLPHEVPAPHKNWDGWHQDAHLKLTEWCRKARDQFPPTWTGAYRPSKLIASNQGLAAIHAKFTADNAGLLVRSADDVNDTHILSGVYALELALAQPINRTSPYFQRPVIHVIESKLDQRTALQKLNLEFRPLDAVVTQGSIDRNRKWVSAKFDMALGLMGDRVLVVKSKQASPFARVQDVADLQSHRLCVGLNWPDRKVLEQAGIPTFTRTHTEELYSALDKGACEGILLAAFEARDQILARPLGDWNVEPYLLLSYPASQQLYVNRDNDELVQAAERGLETMQRTGVLDELLDVLYGDSLQYARVERRRVIELMNPDFPELFVRDQLKFMQPWEISKGP